MHTIGQYKKLIKSTVNVASNAGNVFERSSTFNYLLSMSTDLHTKFDFGEESGKYTADSYHALDPSDDSSAQLWGKPLYSSKLSALPCNITFEKFTVALTKFYNRIGSTTASVNFNDDIKVAGRCWFDDEVYTSSLYKSYNNESQRGRHHIMLEVLHKS